jgi:SAM-dependent methyltransferase
MNEIRHQDPSIFRKVAAERYEGDDSLTTFIEAGWGDFVAQIIPPEEGAKALFGPFTINTPLFYRRVSDLFYAIAINLDMSVKRVCDIGCSTGRLLFEVGLNLDTSEDIDIVGIDPAESISFARQLLGSNLGPSQIIVRRDRGKEYLDIGRALRKILPWRPDLQNSIHFYQCGAESIPRPPNYFDAVFCLNVIDRHPYPRQLLECCNSVLRLGGCAIFASPFDWKDEMTAKEDRIHGFTSEILGKSWRIIAESDLPYELRLDARRVIRYVSRVTVAQKICATVR